mmetsp:Transcript_47586/g.136864  ORF Transcript_47586/g.136864 Transcript_47586/m.136864 type:complete len:428 (+) Transcript_47586:109-1392(+)
MGQKCGLCCPPAATTTLRQAPSSPTVEALSGPSKTAWSGILSSDGCGRRAEIAEETIDPVPPDLTGYGMRPLPLAGGRMMFDIDLYDGDHAKQNVGNYFRMCKDHIGLQVTTSCFSVWSKSKKKNGSGKVIPALPSGGDDGCRIFFFDDNLELEGQAESSGICNLRHAHTGDFIEFGEGRNGFVRDTAATHTVIHHSKEYKNVLVKANILDAMADPGYFVSIIQRYSAPTERLIIYVDVNSTIVCADTVQGKEMANTLLSTMFEFVEVRPGTALDFSFESHCPVKLEKMRTMKQIVKDMTRDDREAYSSFWTPDRCWRLFTELGKVGEVTWSGQEGAFSLDDFKTLYERYLISIPKVAVQDGIAASWFRMHDNMQKKHTIVLNSFGIDTYKVVLATVLDERRVLQVTVNHSLWEDRDVKKFSGQFPS